MGYRSEVGIVVANVDQEGREIVLPPSFFAKDMFTTARKGEDDRLFYADWTKWYEGFDTDIDQIMSFLSELDDEDYLFLRVGEDESDVVHHGCRWDNEFNVMFRRDVTFDESVGEDIRDDG